MTCIAAVLIGTAVGMFCATVLIGVTLWAATALSGRAAKPEQPISDLWKIDE